MPAKGAAASASSAMVRHYHAHVYFDGPDERDRAARLREAIAKSFPAATLGRCHDVPVGPHPRAMYQVAFPPDLLAALLPWLMLNRDRLTILLHPGSGNDYLDHAQHAVWMGGMLPLRLDVLKGAEGRGGAT